MIDDVVGLFWGVVDAAAEGDDRDHIDEGGAVFAVVDDADLALFVGDDILAHVDDGFFGCMNAFVVALDMTGGGLEKAAVAADYFMLFVAGKFEEGRRGVD